jgi:hypothetical protein
MTPFQALQSSVQPALLFVEQAIEQRDDRRQFVGLGLPSCPLFLPAAALRGAVKVAVLTGPTLQPSRGHQLTQGVLDRVASVSVRTDKNLSHRGRGVGEID